MLNLNTPLRTLQALLSIITLALNSYVTHWYRTHTLPPRSPPSPPFLIFTAIFTLLTLPYLFLHPALSPTRGTGPNGRYHNKHAILALDATATLFWFAGFVALAAFQHRLLLCGGHVCQILAGGSAVGGVTWATFLVTTVLAALHVVRTRRGGDVRPERSHAGWVGGAWGKTNA